MSSKDSVLKRFMKYIKSVKKSRKSVKKSRKSIKSVKKSRKSVKKSSIKKSRKSVKKNSVKTSNRKKSYFIHDNGGRPFLVHINPNDVSIYKIPKDNHNDDENDSKKLYTELVKKYNPKQVLVGKSPKNDITIYSGGYDKIFDGNTILLELKDNEYIFIGWNILSFKPKNKIVKYISPVGNSDVPYPYAIDNKGMYYLLIENIIITSVPNEYKNDPYTYYYNNKSVGHPLITKIIVNRL